MGSLNIVPALAVGVALGLCPSAPAKTVFNSSRIEGQGTEIVFCDLDGDHLKDAVLIDGLNLSVFYQDAKQGFPRTPQQKYRLDNRPSVVWAARLGGKAESVLVMTSEGVTELDFANRTGAPASRQIIKQRTVIPDRLEEPEALVLPLAVDTGSDWPLLLVPVADGLQVWQYREGWRQAQLMEHAVDAHIRPLVPDPGYALSFGLNMTVGSVSGDPRDALMVARNVAGGMQIYDLYLQNADGLFTLEPALTYTNQADWRTTLSWADINRDGKLDLVKSTFVNEPFFIPEIRSGKVFVRIFLADEHGRIPAEPRQVFRKNDWSSSLPLVDVDGDGLADLVLGYISAETREGLRKILIAEQVEFSLKFHFQRSGTGFPEAPDYQREVPIRFNREIEFDSQRRLYYEQFISLNGDFNGDGKKDLVARDQKDEISVYFFHSRETGFSPEADLRFRCPEPMEWWEVKDLNGDGVSDLVVKLQKQNAFRIFTSAGR